MVEANAPLEARAERRRVPCVVQRFARACAHSRATCALECALRGDRANPLMEAITMNKNSWNDSLPGTDTLKDTQKTSTTTTPSTSTGTTTSSTTSPSTSYGALGYESHSPTPMKSSASSTHASTPTPSADTKTTSISTPHRSEAQTAAKDVVTEAKDKLDKVVTSGRHALDNVSSKMEKQPYVAMGVAAGVAFGVGTILGSRLLRLASVLGAGYAVAQLMRGDTGKRVAQMVRSRVSGAER
jgi:ElaB/YqjD/DUF883 family membrane-anchored ribosome-binding protein